MAKYTIHYKCGHTEEKTLFGKIENRLSMIKHMEEEICDECATKQAEEKANKEGLPFGVRPSFLFDNMRVKLYACIDGGKQTYYYRNILKEKGYTWTGLEWKKIILAFHWGEAIEAPKTVDGMEWIENLCVACKNTILNNKQLRYAYENIMDMILISLKSLQ